MTQKVQISQDTLYGFLTEHGIKLVRLAEMTGLSEASINSCFKHQIINKGKPRSFTNKAVEKLNMALEQIADTLRQSVLEFGSDQVFQNQRGTIYDPALVEPLKKIGELMNLTALVQRVLGWSKDKKDSILVTRVSKAYGNISQADAIAINNELLAVAGVLSSCEVVADGDDAKPTGCQESAKEKDAHTSMEQTYEGRGREWDNTDLTLQERSRLLHEHWQDGLLLFRVDGGYTAEGDDALYIHKVDASSGMVTLYMDDETLERLLPRFVADGRRIAFTDMCRK